MEPPEMSLVGSADRYCRSCYYCLGDLTDPSAPSVCPECGRAFDKADPKATRASSKRPRSLLLRWPGFVLVLILAIVVIAKTKTLPVPIAGGGGTLWEWRYSKYGYHDGLWWWMGDAYGTRTMVRGDLKLTITLHAGIASRVVAVDANDDHHAFTIERGGDPLVWSLRIDDHALAWPEGGSPELIRAINRTREHRFGVMIYPPADTTRLTPAGPIVATGTEADIFWAYVRAYGLQVDLPERVPRASDGWHPTLEAGERVDYPPTGAAAKANRPRGFFRGR